MRTKRKPWALFTMACLLLGILACAGVTYIVDPFEQYRESSILPLYDQESYNNPGIAKHYDYDAVILGTSMVEMSNPSVICSFFANATSLYTREAFRSTGGDCHGGKPPRNDTLCRGWS